MNIIRQNTDLQPLQQLLYNLDEEWVLAPDDISIKKTTWEEVQGLYQLLPFYMLETNRRKSSCSNREQLLLLQVLFDALHRISIYINEKYVRKGKKQFTFKLLTTDAELLLYAYRSLSYALPVFPANCNTRQVYFLMESIEKQLMDIMPDWSVIFVRSYR